MAWLCCLVFPNTLPNTPDIAAAPEGSYQITATPDRNESAKTQTQGVRASQRNSYWVGYSSGDLADGYLQRDRGASSPLLPRRNSRSLLRRPAGVVVSAVRCGEKGSGTRSCCLPAGEGRWSQAVTGVRVAVGWAESGLVSIKRPGRSE